MMVMMVHKIICIILPVVLISSCVDKRTGDKPNEVVVNSPAENSEHARDTLRGEMDVREEKTHKDSVFVLSTKGEPLIISGSLSKPGDVVTYSFKVSEVSKLVGKINLSTKPANIRFNQIITPTGHSDGPFGQDIEYELTQPGIYKLLVGHSLMAENAYVGPFSVVITLTE